MDYQLAVIDPPWSWAAWGKEQSREVPYPVLTLSDLQALSISSLLAPDAVVLLWVTDPLLPHAMRCVEAWGLTFKTVGFYWTKTRASGKEHIGLGYYTRANPEQCWILTRGKGLPIRADGPVAEDRRLRGFTLRVMGWHGRPGICRNGAAARGTCGPTASPTAVGDGEAASLNRTRPSGPREPSRR